MQKKMDCIDDSPCVLSLGTTVRVSGGAACSRKANPASKASATQTSPPATQAKALIESTMQEAPVAIKDAFVLSAYEASGLPGIKTLFLTASTIGRGRQNRRRRHSPRALARSSKHLILTSDAVCVCKVHELLSKEVRASVSWKRTRGRERGCGLIERVWANA